MDGYSRYIKYCSPDHDSLFSIVNADGSRTRSRTHFKKATVKLLDNGFVLDDEGELELRIYSNIHPRFCELSRKVAYVVDHKLQLCSNVYYCYYCEVQLNLSNLMTVSSTNTRKRMRPSEYDEIKKACVNRTIPEARKFLMEKGIYVTSQQLSSISRSVITRVRTKRGRKPPTSASRLTDRFASSLNRNELLKPVELSKSSNGKVSIIQLVAYPIAFAHYVKVLPYWDDIKEHRRNLEIFESLSPTEAEKEFGKYILSTNASGSLPLFGSSIFIDTTFSIVSGEYVTLAVAITDQFKSASGKNSSFLLALMIHTQKNLEVHEKFSCFLNECLAKESLEKRVPSIIHDGENSFRVYQTGLILKDSISLRCDIHRCENIKNLFKKDMQEFLKFKTAVFGRKKQVDTNVLDAKNWLIKNCESLFNCSSLIKKLEGGWPCHQFLTTNVIESRNSYLKNLIISEITADLALNEFLKIHEDEMRQRKNAVIGQKSTLLTEFCYPHFNTLLKQQQISILKEFGLEGNLNSDIYGDYPNWLTEGDGCMHKDVYLKLLEKISLKQCSDTYFIESDKFISKVEFKHSSLLCCHPTCIKHKDYSYIVCIHMLAVFREMTEDDKQAFVDVMENRRTNRTFEQVRYSTQDPFDGSKFASRHGLQISKNNMPRGFQALSRLSLDSNHSALTFQIDSEANYDTSATTSSIINYGNFDEV